MVVRISNQHCNQHFEDDCRPRQSKLVRYVKNSLPLVLKNQNVPILLANLMNLFKEYRILVWIVILTPLTDWDQWVVQVFLITLVINRAFIAWNFTWHFNNYHAAGASRRRIKNVAKCSKLSTFWNLEMIFRFTMRNALK